MSKKEVQEKLTDDVKSALKKTVRVAFPVYRGEARKYSRRNRKTRIAFLTGYDLLQYTIAVRPYIEKKHGIDTQTLEYLLYLFPFQYFTKSDYKNIPKYGSQYIPLKAMIEQGWVEVAVKHYKAADVFGFTDACHACIKEYYEYLSGEKVIQSKVVLNNPFVDSEQKVLDEQRWALMLKLRGEAERRPSIFRKALFQPLPPREPGTQDS